MHARRWNSAWPMVLWPGLLLISSLGSGALACRTEDPARVPPSVSDPAGPAAAAAPQPSVTPSSEPPLSRDEIRIVVRSKMATVRGCFDAGLDRDPEIGGRVVLRFTIEANGRAAGIEVSEDELGEGVAACLSAAAATWQFPRPRGQRALTLTYPFVFSSERSLRAAGLPRVEGTIKPKAVGAVFEARRFEVDACVPDDAEGRVSLAFIVDDAGQVARSSVLDATLDPAVSACVSRTVSGWRFPPAASGDEARVNHELWW